MSNAHKAIPKQVRLNRKTGALNVKEKGLSNEYEMIDNYFDSVKITSTKYEPEIESFEFDYSLEYVKVILNTVLNNGESFECYSYMPSYIVREMMKGYNNKNNKSYVQFKGDFYVLDVNGRGTCVLKDTEPYWRYIANNSETIPVGKAEPMTAYLVSKNKSNITTVFCVETFLSNISVIKSYDDIEKCIKDEDTYLVGRLVSNDYGDFENSLGMLTSNSLDEFLRTNKLKKKRIFLELGIESELNSLDKEIKKLRNCLMKNYLKRNVIS